MSVTLKRFLHTEIVGAPLQCQTSRRCTRFTGSGPKWSSKYRPRISLQVPETPGAHLWPRIRTHDRPCPEPAPARMLCTMCSRTPGARTYIRMHGHRFTRPRYQSDHIGMLTSGLLSCLCLLLSLSFSRFAPRNKISTPTPPHGSYRLHLTQTLRRPNEHGARAPAQRPRDRSTKRHSRHLQAGGRGVQRL